MLSVLVLCAFIGYRRGLVRTLYRFVSFILALILASRLYPIVSGALRGSFVFDFIRDRIAGATNFEEAFRENVPAPDISEAIRNNNIIEALPLPQPIRDALHNSNTPDMFELLRVSTIEDFITGFFANIIINVLSLIIVFLLVLIILHFAGKALGIVDKIPIIKSFNRAGGLAAGALIGGIIVWLMLFVVIMFFSTGASDFLYGLIDGSALATWLIDSGWMFPRIISQ